MRFYDEKDYIDLALIKKYSKTQVDNHTITDVIEAKKMIETMHDFSVMKKNLVNIKVNISNICKNFSNFSNATTTKPSLFIKA